MSASSGPAGPADQVCDLCGMTFTPRALREHLETGHLGLKCYFPGSDTVLFVEDDLVMVEELLRCNEDRGGGFRDGEFWCHWPNCNAFNQPHGYKYPYNLKRHLRVKQKSIYLYSLSIQPAGPAVVPNPQPAPPDYHVPDQATIDEAILQARLALARREAKYESFRTIVIAHNAVEPLAPDQRTQLRAGMKEVDDAFDETFNAIYDIVGEGPDGSLIELWTTYADVTRDIEMFLKFWLNHFLMLKDQLVEWGNFIRLHGEFHEVVNKILDAVGELPSWHRPVKAEEADIKAEETAEETQIKSEVKTEQPDTE
ncbi:hypothetical protein GL218_01571 [Daldinia childiae]|uniref:uncharacterized protein n=1 Tax=Daldinia childiae TaxID=326645 RepID=UPI0014457B13|nr:uncharacterized protein GL218_01571 [Daldinia childiae]KAF3064963.1 hypothetical protein GL218_01571 [Daldinia childiae]